VSGRTTWGPGRRNFSAPWASPRHARRATGRYDDLGRPVPGGRARDDRRRRRVAGLRAADLL